MFCARADLPQCSIHTVQDVATWLLIYHVVVEQKAQDVATGGAAQIAFAVLSDDACHGEWSSCATLLARLTADEECVDLVSRIRSAGRTGPVILLTHMLNSTASTQSRIQASESLINMLLHPDCSSHTLGCLQGAVQWGDFRSVLTMESVLNLKAKIARVAMHMLSKVVGRGGIG